MSLAECRVERVVHVRSHSTRYSRFLAFFSSTSSARSHTRTFIYISSPPLLRSAGTTNILALARAYVYVRVRVYVCVCVFYLVWLVSCLTPVRAEHTCSLTLGHSPCRTINSTVGPLLPTSSVSACADNSKTYMQTWLSPMLIRRSRLSPIFCEQ